MHAILSEAVQLHQRGQLDAAKALYRRVLAHDGREPNALHFLGVIARQQGDAEEAVRLITQAVQLKPGQANQHCNLGAALQDLGRAADALAQYEQAIALEPRYALALSNRGNALRHLGRLDEALASYERALACKPDYPEAWCNRAIALNDLGRPGEARASADRALQARPNNAEAWVARANALQGQGCFSEALDSYERALGLKDDGEIHCSRGTALQRLGRFEDALLSYQRAIALRPRHPLAHLYRANALRALGRVDDAIAAYRSALALGGEREQIEFAMAALGAGSAPEASPGSYVRQLFDQYADHFDEHLVERLGYHTPALLDGAIRRHAGAVQHGEVIDLGCGTGLCAPYLRPSARTLTGVDMSPKMIGKARERGLYDTLVCADITAYLAERDGKGEREADLIVAADVLVYLGELDGLFANARRVLRPAGLFCFSVEAGEGEGFTLRPSQRYAHALPYLQGLAASHGFDLLEAERQPLRRDGDTEILGFIVTLRRAG
jgi:predicted TPR repeat methyltransferase